MAYTITLIPGDGVGPEISEATRRVLEATGVKFKWELAYAGAEVMEKYGTPLPDSVLESIRKNKVAIKGPVTTPVGTGFRSVNVALRKALDLYACVRPCKTYPGAPTPFDDVNIVIVRENTEDLYAGVEFEKGTAEAGELIDFINSKKGDVIKSDSGLSIKMITESGSRRIIKYAFEYARRYGRKKVTATQKANIMKYSDGLFLSVAREVASKYPDIEFQEALIDNLCMQLVRRPQEYDVIVAPNLYGDIISDLCAGLVGGLGLAPGANIGDEIALFEPTHGSAPKYTGQNRVNPMAMMLSGVLMLRYIGEVKAADRLEKAIAAVIKEGKSVTYDMKSHRDDPSAVGTSQVADAVIKKLK
ncbi:MAG TPA: isocitrate/isopropylmalate dehydrogenase family protein [Dehalococcoidales bacterium]|nr:isocitrate/isopropylmalate dehydrogenase family protein [Dehalococcoidales bacterium]